MKALVTILIVITGYAGLSQSLLKGKIMDSKTKIPVTGASIFLSNTSIGTNSNDKGEFSLNIPAGSYELIVTSLNYDTYILQLEPGNFQSDITVILNEAPKILPDVIVESYDKNGWSKWGKYFTSNFIGNTNATKKCNLKNPEAVKFKFNENTNSLRAFTNDVLLFENQELGYRIKYVLLNFKIDFNNNSFKFAGHPAFENLVPKSEKEQQKWMANRAEVYAGSLRQFMKSLYNDRLEAEGFEIRPVVSISEIEKARVAEINKRIASMEEVGGNPKLRMNKDSLSYYQDVFNLAPGDNTIALNKKIKRADIVKSTKTDAVLLNFEGVLRVTCTLKKTPVEFYVTVQRNSHSKYTSTDINLPQKTAVIVYKNGTYFSGENFLVDGFWSWSEKLATMLPNDYGSEDNRLPD